MQASQPLAALNINLDSIRVCLKLAGGEVPSRGFRDPAFFDVMDRFLAVADELDAPLSIYVVGKDLEDAGNRGQVRRWAEAGHEIGNHSYSHYGHLGELSAGEIHDEVARAHDRIGDCIGRAPTGFIAPAWSYSPELPDSLQRLGYRYDTSLFPSFTMPVIQARLRWRSRRGRQRIPLIRKDLPGSIFGATQPFYASRHSPWRSRERAGDLLMLPLPTTRLRAPLWHTLAFVAGTRRFARLLDAAMRRSRAFYYLMHPADLFCPERDLDGLPSSLLSVERMGVAYERKRRLIQRSLRRIAKTHRFVTMSELAESAAVEIATGSGPPSPTAGV